ncbi:DUF899 family protein [Microvirga sp. GCM10011540]|uniref:DUF899 family protein n=1 Tax=Microvirga sp. GCM10011540 TaxID=3317338 RepID=UPI00361923EA
MTTSSEDVQRSELRGMKTPAVVTAEEWKAPWEKLHVKEKAHSRARDALAAERRRMPWLADVKDYAFEGAPNRVFTRGTHSAEHKPTPLIQLV